MHAGQFHCLQLSTHLNTWIAATDTNSIQAIMVANFLQGCGWATDEMCAEYAKSQKTKPFLNSGVMLASLESLLSTLETHFAPLHTTPDHDQA